MLVLRLIDSNAGYVNMSDVLYQLWVGNPSFNNSSMPEMTGESGELGDIKKDAYKTLFNDYSVEPDLKVFPSNDKNLKF